MKQLKTICGLFIFTLFVFLLVGCGGTESGNNDTATSTEPHEFENVSIQMHDGWTLDTLDEGSEYDFLSRKDDFDDNELINEEAIMVDSEGTNFAISLYCIDTTSYNAETVDQIRDNLLESDAEGHELTDITIDGHDALKDYFTATLDDGGDEWTYYYVELPLKEKKELYEFWGMYPSSESTTGDAIMDTLVDSISVKSSSEDEASSKNTVQGINFALDDSWEKKSLDGDSDYAFASQKDGEEPDALLEETAFEKTTAGQAVLVYCFDCDNYSLKSTNDAKKNLLSSGTVKDDEVEDITIDGEAAIRTKTKGTYEGYDWTYLNVYTVKDGKMYEIYCPFTKDDIDMTPYFNDFIDSITFK